MKKRILPVLVAVMTVLSLTACAKPTAESVLKKMALASAKENMLEAVWNMDMAMGMKMDLFDLDMTISMLMDGDTKGIASEKVSESDIKVSADLGIAKQDMDMKVYTKQEDDTHITTYTMVEDEWVKTVTELPEGYANVNSITDLEGFAEKFTLAEEKETVNDVSCFKLSGELPVEEMLEKLSAMGVGGTATESVGDEILKDKSYMTVLYVDEKTSLPVRIEMKLADSTAPAEPESTAETAAAETTAAAEPEKEPEIDTGENTDAAVTLDKLDINMDFSYPDDIAITIPEEALAAEEVSEDALSDMMEEEADITEDENYVPVGSYYDHLDNAAVLKEFTGAESELFTSDTVDITAEKAYTDADGIIYCDFHLANKTDKEVNILSDYLSYNGVMGEDGIFESIEPGGEITATLAMTNLADRGVRDPGTLVIRFTASDNETGDEVCDIPISTLVLGDAPAAAPAEGGTDLFENDSLKVIAYPQKEDDYNLIIPLCMINKTADSLSVEAVEPKIEGVEINSYVYQYLYAGCIGYVDICVDKEEMKEKQIEDLSGLNLKLTAAKGDFAAEEYEEVFTTDVITVVK